MKKNQPKPQRPRVKREDSELSSLNSSLGSFGLEPPKRYRPEQKQETQKRTVRRPSRNENKPRKTLDERRVEENRHRKNAKLRRKILFYAGLIVSIVAVLVVLSLTVFFKIDTITIKGNKIYKTQEITAVLPIEKGSNLFLCDTDKASAKLEENLPYIYKAEIKRKIFSTIIVNITETPTVYSVKNADKTFTLLDGNLKVLENSARNNKKAISINRVKLKSAIAGQKAEFTESEIQENITVLTKAVSDLKLDKVSAVYSSDINNNFIVYDSRITIKLGTLDNLENKIYSALTAIEKLNESNPQAEGVLTVTDNKQVYFSEK